MCVHPVIDGEYTRVSKQVVGNAETERNAGNPRLVFHRYGSKYFLAEIWAGGGQGMVLPKTRQEQEYLASAQNAEPEQTVLLAMN